MVYMLLVLELWLRESAEIAPMSVRDQAVDVGEDSNPVQPDGQDGIPSHGRFGHGQNAPSKEEMTCLGSS